MSSPFELSPDGPAYSTLIFDLDGGISDIALPRLPVTGRNPANSRP
jgi:hypothetical protein